MSSAVHSVVLTVADSVQAEAWAGLAGGAVHGPRAAWAVSGEVMSDQLAAPFVVQVEASTVQVEASAELSVKGVA